jgi:hypothetical protein
MRSKIQITQWSLGCILTVAACITGFAAAPSANIDAQFRPASTILDSENLNATRAATAQAIQQMQATTAAQQKQTQAYLQQVMQQISAAGKIPETGATATTNQPQATPSAATPAVTKPTAQPTQQAPATATGLPDTNTTTPDSAESWPLGF